MPSGKWKPVPCSVRSTTSLARDHAPHHQRPIGARSKNQKEISPGILPDSPPASVLFLNEMTLYDDVEPGFEHNPTKLLNPSANS
jgi:hypothetical protein